MKRHRALEPFSRDHYSGLVAARHLKNSPGPNSVAELLSLWKDELEDHFHEEENLLAHRAPPDLEFQLRREHEEIRLMIAQAESSELSNAEIVLLGERLHDHIRWEERVLFPALELDPGIEEIEPKSQAMEQRRQGDGHHPRRAELVNRRKRRDSG